MTDEITKNMSDSEKLDFIINAVSDLSRRMTMLEERQTALETLVHNRLQDTRPIWQAVLQQLETMQQQQHVMQQQQQAQQEQLDRLEKIVLRIDQKYFDTHMDYAELRTDMGLLSKRVTGLENLRQAA